MHIIERRFNTAKVRATEISSAPNSPGNLTGYASVANSLSEDLGGFRERVANGAFRNSLLARADVRALVNHDPSLIIGRTANGSLRLSEDPTGLRMECDVADTSYGRDLISSVKRGDISQMSFAFQAEDEDWSEEDDPENPDERISIRTLKSVKLLDVSAVTYPAYASTSITSMQPTVMERSHNQLFPYGLPQEVRSRLGNAALNPRSQEARRRLFSMFVG